MNDLQIRRTIGRGIKQARLASIWTQGELGDEAGCGKAHIAGIEAGKKICSLPLFVRLCTVLGVAPGSILGPKMSIEELRGHRVAELLSDTDTNWLLQLSSAELDRAMTAARVEISKSRQVAAQRAAS